jgi:hypothetical protein
LRASSAALTAATAALSVAAAAALRAFPNYSQHIIHGSNN